MKLSLSVLCVMLTAFQLRFGRHAETIRNMRGLRVNNLNPERRLNWLVDQVSEQVGNPYGFIDHFESTQEEELHHRNMVMYMDMSKREGDVRKLTELVNEFPEHLDEFSERINDMLNQISMAVGSDVLLKQRL